MSASRRKSFGVWYERAGVIFIGNSHFETEILRNARELRRGSAFSRVLRKSKNINDSDSYGERAVCLGRGNSGKRGDVEKAGRDGSKKYFQLMCKQRKIVDRIE